MPGSRQELEIFLDYINNIVPTLKFTLENEDNNKITFLDLTILKTPTKFQLDIFRKPTTCSALVPFDSCHHHSQKYAAFRFMVQRMLKLPLDEATREKEREVIKYLGELNGFQEKTINKIFTREKIKQHPLYTREVTTTIPAWRSFTNNNKYVGHVNRFLNKGNIS